MKAKKLKKWLLNIPVVVSVLVALAYFGLDFSGYRPVWAFEHQALQQDFEDHMCDQLSNSWYRVMETKAEYDRRQERMPEWLVDELRDILKDGVDYECYFARPR